MVDFCYPIQTIMLLIAVLSFICGMNFIILYQYLYAYLRDKKRNRDHKKAMKNVFKFLEMINSKKIGKKK